MTAPDSDFDRAQAETYLRSLFSDIAGFIELRTISKDGHAHRTFHSTVEGALRQVEEAVNQQRNVYVGIAERHSNTTGTKENLGLCWALWIDADYKNENDREIIDERVNSFPMPPSLRVWSGGGEHIYWLFEEPFELSSERARTRFENTLRGLCDYFHADRAATDSTRILRVPGTTNYPNAKKQAAGRTESPCVLRSACDARYTLNDFEEFERRGISVKRDSKPVEFESKQWTGDLPDSVQAAAADNAWIQSVLHNRHSDFPVFKSASEADFGLAKCLARLNVPGADIENALRWRQANVDIREKPDDYFHRTAATAMGAVARSDDAARTSESPGESDTVDPLDVQLEELARLPPIEYDRCRCEVAQSLGIRRSTLDKQVDVRRRESSQRASAEEWVLFAEIEPWPDAVNGAELLSELAAEYKRFLALPEFCAETMALWTVHAHAHSLSQISPILAFVSPEKRCGKTTALALLGRTTPRPLSASNITSASLFRSVEKWCPTLLVDEADTFLRDSDELRGVFNSGHNRSQAGVIRTTGDDHEPRVYSTWSPKVIAMIGSLPGTLEDRSIVIQMRRRRRSEKVERFRIDRDFGLNDLARKCARWVADNRDDLRDSDPETPSALNDRACDNWRALLPIADAAGGKWPQIARKAAEALTPTEDESSIGTLLLADIREILIKRSNPERISSTDLCEALLALPDRPWPEITRGKPLNTNTLSRRLKPFGIRPRQLRIEVTTNVKGYVREDFTEAFERYLSTDSQEATDQTETSKQISKIKELEQQQIETRAGECFGLESPNSLQTKECFGVSSENMKPGEDETAEWGEV